MPAKVRARLVRLSAHVVRAWTHGWTPAERRFLNQWLPVVLREDAALYHALTWTPDLHVPVVSKAVRS